MILPFINTYFRGDRVIWAVVFLLSLFSALAVYSSTGALAYKEQEGNTEYYLVKHSMLLLSGFLIIFVFHNIRYTYYSRLSQIALWLSVPLLLLTLSMGAEINQAERWLTLPGTGLTFQTSDFAKLALIMFVARLLSKKQGEIKDFKKSFLPVVGWVSVICALILPANFSTAAMLFLTCLLLMFLGRVSMRYILGLVGAGLVFTGILCAVLFTVNEDNLPGRMLTWKHRIENHFLSRDNGAGNYQVQQSKIAIASGGFAGKGPGKSTQRNFLPHPYSDFIFAIAIEEYGSIPGGTAIVLLYMILFYRIARIAIRSPGTFGSLLALGCGLILMLQAVINMAVAVNLLPVTGQTLPLVSMGGTSIFFTAASLGIILSISRETVNAPTADARA